MINRGSFINYKKYLFINTIFTWIFKSFVFQQIPVNWNYFILSICQQIEEIKFIVNYKVYLHIAYIHILGCHCQYDIFFQTIID